jgi:hypothetical protein
LHRAENATNEVFADQGTVVKKTRRNFDVMLSRHFAALQPRNAAK